MKLADVIDLRAGQRHGGDPLFMTSAKRMLKRMKTVKRNVAKQKTYGTMSMPSSWYTDPHAGSTTYQAGLKDRLNGASG